MVFSVTAQHVKFGELGLGHQGAKVLPGVPRVLANCGVDIPKGLDGVPLAAEVLIDPQDAQSVFETILPLQPEAV